MVRGEELSLPVVYRQGSKAMNTLTVRALCADCKPESMLFARKCDAGCT